MKITINDQTFDITAEQEAKLKKALGINKRQLSDVAIGSTFTVADIEFIKFDEKNGAVSAVTRDVLFKNKFDSRTNNFKKSYLFEYLAREVLPKVQDAVGYNNILAFETDLTSLDGLNDYGTLYSKVSLPTFDFYRKHIKIFDKYKASRSWWLSTPHTTLVHGGETSICIVCTHGSVRRESGGCSGYGVRPFFTFKSSIFVS